VQSRTVLFILISPECLWSESTRGNLIPLLGHPPLTIPFHYTACMLHLYVACLGCWTTWRKTRRKTAWEICLRAKCMPEIIRNEEYSHSVRIILRPSTLRALLSITFILFIYRFIHRSAIESIGRYFHRVGNVISIYLTAIYLCNFRKRWPWTMEFVCNRLLISLRLADFMSIL